MSEYLKPKVPVGNMGERNKRTTCFRTFLAIRSLVGSPVPPRYRNAIAPWDWKKAISPAKGSRCDGPQ